MSAADENTSAYARVLMALSDHGKIDENGSTARARCPAHNGNSDTSLAVRRIDGSVLIHCHAGCETADVLAALALQMRDLFDDHDGAEYRYADGRIVRRTPDKRFWQEGNTKGRALFHADRIANADVVYVVEGEKDVLAIEAIGAAAVCSAMGAGKADRFDWSPLAGKCVVVIADRDEPGLRHARQVTNLVKGIAAVVEIKQAATGKDAADHIAAGLTLDELEPADLKPVDGVKLLDDLRAFLTRFVVYPGTHHRTAHTLWIAHCWWMDHWESTPRIAFLSPEPASGKSRALEVTEPLVPRPVFSVNTSPAYLFRKVSDPLGLPTILYDECDTLFGPKAKEHEEVRGMINAGHRKGATAGRCVVRGKIVETEELPAYCAVALAGLDDLPDTLMSRAVIVRMKRRAPVERVEPWRRRINGPEAVELYNRLLDWSSAATPLQEGWPTMPEGVEDRDADIWEALLAVADLAGGYWPKTARAAAVALVAESRARQPSTGVQLLYDIRTVFGDSEWKATVDLLTALNDMEDAPWAVIRKGHPLNARGLSNRLGKYGIGPQIQRFGMSVLRGYSRIDFEDAWSRYLSEESVTSVTSATSQVRDPGPETSVTDDLLQADEHQGTPTSGVADVTDVTDSLEADLDDYCCWKCGTPLGEGVVGYCQGCANG
jgi:hypothetical protein